MANTWHLSDPWTASDLPNPTMKFLKQYFADLDNETEEGAKGWVTSFAKNGAFVQNGRVIEGEDALYMERHFMWRNWPGLRHTVKCIYVLPGYEHRRFLVVGVLTIEDPKGGPTIRCDTAGAFHLIEENGALKIQRLEVYNDPTPLLRLLEEREEQ